MGELLAFPFMKTVAWAAALGLMVLLAMRRPGVRRRTTLVVLIIALRAVLDALAMAQPKASPALASGLWVAFVLLVAALVMGLLRDLSLTWLRRRKLRVSGLFWDVAQVVVFSVLLLVLLKRAFNLNITPLLATSAVLTMVVGLAVQDTLGNLISGIVFHFEDSIRPGEWVEVDGILGEVTGLSWRAISLTTPNQELMVIPNHDFTKKRFCNLSRTGAARVHAIGLSYEVDPDEAVQVLRRAMLSTPGIRRQPEPVAHILSFGDSSVQYRLKYFLEDYRLVNAAVGAVHRNVWYFLKNHRMNIPFPIRTVHLERRKPPVRDDRSAILVALQGLDIFQGFEPEELDGILQFAELQDFDAGAVLAEEGEVGRSMAVLVRGTVQVAKGGTPLAILGPGDVYGEISLFTGDRCSASVVASSPVAVVAIRREGFDAILRRNGAFLQKIEAMIRLRQGAQGAQADPTAAAEAQGPLLDRIRRYLLG